MLTAQSARDAQATGYNRDYVEYLERTAIEHRDYFLRQGDTERAALMMTQSLSSALTGNDGA